MEMEMDMEMEMEMRRSLPHRRLTRAPELPMLGGRPPPGAPP